MYKNRNLKHIPNLLTNWNKVYEFRLFISYWVFSWTRLVRRSKKVKSNTCPFLSCAIISVGILSKKFEKNMLAQFLLSLLKAWQEFTTVWQYGLWSFQTGGTKLERISPKNQHTQRKLLNFENWISGGLRSS